MRGRPQRLAAQKAVAARVAAEAEKASTSKSVCNLCFVSLFFSEPSGPQRAVGHRAKKAYLREDDQHYHRCNIIYCHASVRTFVASVNNFNRSVCNYAIFQEMGEMNF